MDEFDIYLDAPNDATPEELRRYFQDACGQDPQLLKKVEALASLENEAGRFMDSSPMKSEATLTNAEAAGAVIGHYKLLQKIGEGGFGTVFMAEQMGSMKRRVALKIIKLGMDTRQVVARFEVERQALAMMDHPNIAKVFDAGATETGRPYFVMELVRGIPITHFCEEQKLDTAARLTLFTEVCRAIQHAHQKGVIHRDLKPSNIIVSLHDDKAMPKVIDFGVAKATQQDLTDKTLFTQFEQLIGTPAYMSPEQTQMGGVDIDTRSDIYALGVLLYELLTGTTPFDAKALAKSGQDEVRRIIREQDPPKPSTRLTELRNGKMVVVDHHVPKCRIDQDLDWIVMKALEKDRSRRYETATGLVADIQRHLNGLPVEAGAPSSSYRFRKFVYRNRRALLTAGLIVAILVVATVISILSAVDAQRANKLATSKGEEAERGRAEAQLLFAEEQLGAGKTEEGIAHLARLIRQTPESRIANIAAERLFSVVRQRPLPQLLMDFEKAGFEKAALSADGSKVVTATLDGFVCVRETSGGDRISPLMQTRPDGVIDFIEFSPSEDMILIGKLSWGSQSATAYVWDWRRGELVCEPLELESRAQVCTFSPDGKSVLMGCPGPTYVWDLQTGERHFEDPIHYPGYTGVFSPDSQTVMFTGGRLHDARTGDPIRTIGKRGEIISAAFRSDGKRLVTACRDQAVRLWDPDSGALLGVLPHRHRVQDAEFSPDGSLIATGSWDGRARLWGAASAQLLEAYEHPGQKVETVEFSADGQRLIVTTLSGDAKVWRLHVGEAAPLVAGKALFRQTTTLSQNGLVGLVSNGFSRAHLWKLQSSQPASQIFRQPENPNVGMNLDNVWVVNFSPDGHRIVTAGVDRFARIWDARSGAEQHRLRLHDGWQWRAEFSADGAQILTTDASITSASGFAVWDAETGDKISQVETPGPCRHAAFRPVKDEKGDYWVASAPFGSRSAQLYNATTGEEIGPPLTHGGQGSHSRMVLNNHRAMFSPDGMRVVTATDDGSARVWSVPDGELISELKGHTGFLESAVFSANGHRIVTASADGTARLWDAHRGVLLHVLPHGKEGVTYAEFNPDGDRVITASLDGTARIWKVTNGQPVGLTLRHEAMIRTVRFSPDGRRLVTASYDRTARVWDAETGHALSDPLRHDGFVNWACFSPDGNRVATAGCDNTARLWDLPSVPTGVVPDWVPGWAEAISGLTIDDADTATPVSLEEREQLMSQALGLSEDSFYARTAKWFYEDKSSRLITPFSRLSVEDWVENRIKEDTVDSLQEAIRVSPDHPVALANLARALMKSPHREAPGNLLRVRNLLKRAITLDPDKKGN